MTSLVVALALLTTLACSDNPIAPDKDLVGSWHFGDTDFVDVLLSGFTTYARDQGMDEDRIREFERETRANIGENPLGRTTIRLNADGSYEDNHGDKGSWDVYRDELIMSIDNQELRPRYFVDGDELTLIFELLEVLEQGFDDEDYLLFRQMFNRNATFRIFWRRR